ncbi:hypothetical protein QL285_034467 [Trifolium repens]|nr:hypothetical protein QL285_034467 [Trifolium repens]
MRISCNPYPLKLVFELADQCSSHKNSNLKFLARYARCSTRCSSNLSGLARNRIKQANEQIKNTGYLLTQFGEPTSGGYQSRKEYHYNSPSPKSPANYPFTT